MNQTIENHPLQYYMHDGSSAFRFELAGDLTGEGARRLEHDWRSASSVIGHRDLIVDITFMTGADEEGRALLVRWRSNGARIVATSKASRELAEAILGEPLPESAFAASAGSYQTWQPFRSSFVRSALHLILLAIVLLFPARVHAVQQPADRPSHARHLAHVPSSFDGE
jgi:hypothetical protein